MPWTHPQTGIVYQCQDDKCLAGKTDDTWRKFMLLTGRGFGKTEAGSNWLVDQAIKNPNTTWGVAAPTEGDLFKTCFNGDSGLLAQLREGELSDYNMNRHTVKLSNGSEIRGFTVDNPQRIRGANLHGLWIDEIAASIRGEEFLKYTALAAVRLGRSQIVFTTTPQPTPLMRKLVGGAFGKIHVTRGSMYENTALSEDAVEDLRKTFLGSRVGRQELEGELLDEFEGALFNRKDLDDYRILPGMKVPKYANIVVGFDPAMKSGEESDESGIVVVASAEMNDGFDHAFILDDQSIRGTPAEVAKRVAIAAQTWEASCVYYESNQGGDWIKDSLRSIDPTLPCREAHSSRGKIMRAEPVSALCEAGRIHMVGTFIELEEELCIMRPNAKSKGGDDDRADACIAKGTLVLTARGEIPVENVLPGDLAWTRAGWKPVMAAWLTRENAETKTVILSDGRELTATPDHKIWTENRGWQQLDALVHGDILSGWTNILSKSPAPVSVVRVCESDNADVYDLTIADVHEFTANGVIVHNCIHAIWGLKLVSYGSYTLAYGQITCAGCDKLYFRGRQSCPHCGLVREVIMEEQERPPRGSWADAYMDICRRCGNRFPKHSQCAKCDLSAQAFMAQVAVLTGNPGGNTGKHGYMGRDWLSGRKT